MKYAKADSEAIFLATVSSWLVLSSKNCFIEAVGRLTGKYLTPVRSTSAAGTCCCVAAWVAAWVDTSAARARLHQRCEREGKRRTLPLVQSG